MDKAWQADLARVGGSYRAFLREQSIWAIWVYRFGRRVDARDPGVAKRFLLMVYWALHRCVETLTGIGLPKQAQIGGGLRIWHFGGVFVHPLAVLGEGCTLRQGVTIGDKGDGSGAPVLGSGVDLGAYAQVIGPVTVGDQAVIGAMAVVVKDVPAGATVVGNPARIIRQSNLS